MARRPHANLERARAQVEAARARGADPWRIQELMLAYDRALAAALDVEEDEGVALAPAPRVGRGGR